MSLRPHHRIKHGGRPAETFLSLTYPDIKSNRQTNGGIIPDSFGVTVKMEDGYKLGDPFHVLQVINGIIQVSLPLFVKVDQPRGAWSHSPALGLRQPVRVTETPTVKANVVFILQFLQQQLAVTRVQAFFDDLLQPHGVQENGIVEIGGVRADLKKKSDKTTPNGFPLALALPSKRGGACLSLRRQVAPERASLETLKNLLEEVVVLVSFVGLLSDDEGHVKRCDGNLVVSVARAVFPQVVLEQGSVGEQLRGSNAAVCYAHTL